MHIELILYLLYNKYKEKADLKRTLLRLCKDSCLHGIVCLALSLRVKLKFQEKPSLEQKKAIQCQSEIAHDQSKEDCLFKIQKSGVRGIDS